MKATAVRPGRRLANGAAVLLTALVATSGATDENEAVQSDVPYDALASLARSCVHNEYPNVIRHHLLGREDVQSPRELHPAFYGCLDWHSSVHGHWTMVRLLNANKGLSEHQLIAQHLDTSLSTANILGELEYFAREGAGTTFERPYGLAWLLQLSTELRESTHPNAEHWLSNLQPLENRIVEIIVDWLPKLTYPIRTGEHSQTAFAFGLMHDWSRSAGNSEVSDLLEKRVKDLYLSDSNCPLAYEPSGQDFLSPCLAEADLLRRILTPSEFASWLSGFLPQIPDDGSASWINVAIVTDRTDGKLGHLDGLNLSRAWMLHGIASGLPVEDKRRPSLLAAAELHQAASVPIVLGDLHYMGSHWLGSFATYLLTHRGVDDLHSP